MWGCCKNETWAQMVKAPPGPWTAISRAGWSETSWILQPYLVVLSHSDPSRAMIRTLPAPGQASL